MGKGYISINSARSALSTLLGPVEGNTIGNNPIVVRFLKGVSRLRPPTPKYKTTWDSDIVLNFIDKSESNENLSLTQLTLKLVALMLLCSGHRIQTLNNIKLHEIKENGDELVINIENRLKTSKAGVGTTIRFRLFHNRKLCVITCLKYYIEKTKALRQSEYLFVQCKAPHQRASCQTISRWAKETLILAGVNTLRFFCSQLSACLNF
ncbi:hypothetical protein Ocin01_19619 [Orchesella cincta]|uniref:Tyr recombinase domain-containing protein n=1 Tax=Orchesella cincta TaxID=48709 RepID=A0A1D2M264_ORCCI|nr:hypothetical protein Ocin01_19619 [Orchesella cincta]